MLRWDIQNNCELEAYTIENDHQVLFDSHGNINIYDGDCLIISQQLCKIKSFEINDFQSRNETIQEGLEYNKGVRFDVNNNWLVLRQYICLPFSYMTFVIKEEMDNKVSFDEVAFDIEPYNYIINQSSCFLDGNLSKNNYN